MEISHLYNMNFQTGKRYKTICLFLLHTLYKRIYRLRNLYYYRRAVHKNLSPKFDRFLDGRSQFYTDHGVDFYAPTCYLSTTFVHPLFEFVLCFLRQKIINNVTFRHRCDFYAAVFA